MDSRSELYESFEDYFEPRPPSGKRKSKNKHREKEVRRLVTPEDHIKNKLDELKANKINTNTYLTWVKRCFDEGETSFEESDLRTVKDVKEYVKIIHLPTQIIGQDFGTLNKKVAFINANADCYLNVDGHFKLWEMTSESFRKIYLS